MLEEAPPTPEQMTADLDFQQSLAQLFTLIPYGQLILEQAQLDGTPQDVVDMIFETLVRDFTTTPSTFTARRPQLRPNSSGSSAASGSPSSMSPEGTASTQRSASWPAPT